MILILYFFIFLFLAFLFLYVFLRKKVTAHKPDSFPNEEKIKTLTDNAPVIVCFGDSNTHGNVSYDWVKDLTDDLPNMQVMNAGLNSDLSFSLLRRIKDVISCKPDFIIHLNLETGLTEE